jgi:hypothetical protein
MGKSQETPQFAVGRNGTRGLGAAAPIMAFSLEDTPQQAAGFFIGLSSLMGSKISIH